MEKVFADDYSGGIAGAYAGFFRRHSTGSLFRNTKIEKQGDEEPDSKLNLWDCGRIRIASGSDCCPLLRNPFQPDLILTKNPNLQITPLNGLK